MGGRGSGRIWYGGAGGAGGKDTTEDHRRIDIRWLKKQKFLRPGNIGSLSWTRGEEQVGSIGFRMEADLMTLIYRYRVNDGEWEDVEQVVRFDRTLCHFGGFRKWFLCPQCGKRMALLYGAGKYFLCRHCYDLVYTCQQEIEIDRMMRKARKIRDRLGASHNLSMPIWRKPKGMHQRTFDRLRDQENETNTLKWRLIGDRMGMDL